MGQKAHPKGLRLKIVEDWESSWFAEKSYGQHILDDLEIRRYVKENFKKAGVAKIKINRQSDKIEVVVTAARTGMIVGKGGELVSEHRQKLSDKFGTTFVLTIVEEKTPEKNAALLAESICSQIERRTPFRRAMKMAVQWAMKAGAKGVKVTCSGRLGGLEIARSESYQEGKMPLHTLRADIDYVFSEALTTYGKIGVKVWVYNGEVLDHAARMGRLVASENNAPVGVEQ